MERDAPVHLFVYGTLRRGFRNHAAYAADALEAEDAEIEGELYALPGWPALVLGGGAAARGELLRFPDLAAKLAVLDSLEGVGGPPWPEGVGFLRAAATARRLRDSRRVPTWVYVHPAAGREALLRSGAVRVASGDWATHVRAGAGGRIE